MNQNALVAAEILVAAYQRGEENGAHVDWNDINDAHRFAMEALAEFHGVILDTCTVGSFQGEVIRLGGDDGARTVFALSLLGPEGDAREVIARVQLDEAADLLAVADHADVLYREYLRAGLYENTTKALAAYRRDFPPGETLRDSTEGGDDGQRPATGAPALRVRVALIREDEPRYRFTIRSAADIWDMLREEAKAWDRERLLVVALDGANQVTGVETVSIGLLTSCQVHPREVFKGLILANAARFIAVHNHPSGSCTPSAEDRDVTKKLKAAGELVGIPLLDHVILGADAYHSFADTGQL